MSARILIGASSHAFGRGLADSLERDAELTVVGILDDTAAIVRAAERMRPDMVALELDLPGAGGVAATQRIMHEHPTRIVVITSHQERRSSTAWRPPAMPARSPRRGPPPHAFRPRLAPAARLARPAPAEPSPDPSAALATTSAGAQHERLSRALQAADRGDLDTALKIAGAALAEDPLDAQAHFITGVAELAREAPRAAVDSLRRALYADPSSSLAAFHLARAHDALGEQAPARRAYEQVLRTLELDREERSVAQTRDFAAMTAACRARLGALAGAR